MASRLRVGGVSGGPAVTSGPYAQRTDVPGCLPERSGTFAAEASAPAFTARSF